MYSLDDDVKQDKAGGSGIGVFQPNVKVRFMQLKNQPSLLFKILPAYDPATLQLHDGVYTPTDLRSWTSFRNPETHQLQVFARKIHVAGFIGHGRGKDGRRRDILSPLTFAEGDGETYCPIRALHNAAESDARWDYLTKDKLGADGKTVIEGPSLSYVGVQLLVNIFDVTGTQPKCELGVFTASAYKSLLSRDNPVGLVWQTANIADPAYLQQHPMMRWAAGDLTNPINGPVLTMTKGEGVFGRYNIHMAKDAAGNVMCVSIPEYLLEQRYNLLHLESIVKRESEEEIIRRLVKLLNGVSPTTGEHEWVLLKNVFGNIVGKDVIPDPPAQGYTHGFTAPVPQPPAMHPGVPGIPGMQQQSQYPGVYPQQQSPGVPGVPQYPVNSAPPMMPPGAIPMVQTQAGVPSMDNPSGRPYQPVPGVPPMPQITPPEQSLMSQAAAGVQGYTATPQQQPHPQAQGFYHPYPDPSKQQQQQAPPAQTQATPPTGAEQEGAAPVPGDKAPGFSAEGFMDRLRGLGN